MKRIAIAMATSALAITMLAGTAQAENDGSTWTPKCDVMTKSENYTNGNDEWDDDYDDCDYDGHYPPKPKQVYLPTPSVDYGSSLTVKGKGLCPGVPAIFAVQSNADWTNRVFSAGQYVGPDGTSWYTFSAGELANIYGGVTVYVKQMGKCEGAATTGGTIVKKAAPAPDPKPVDPKNPLKPANEGSGALAPAAAAPATNDAPAVVPVQQPSAVLSAGVTAPAAASAAVTPAAAAPAAPAAAAAPTVAAQSGDSLPVTGSEPSQVLQIALVAFAAGLGMVIVTSIRRRTAGARTR